MQVCIYLHFVGVGVPKVRLSVGIAVCFMTLCHTLCRPEWNPAEDTDGEPHCACQRIMLQSVMLVQTRSDQHQPSRARR